MATVDRIDPVYTAWSPSAAGLATDDEEYVGRHRRSDLARAFSFTRLFYVARHRRR
jgi:hypothetical protein